MGSTSRTRLAAALLLAGLVALTAGPFRPSKAQAQAAKKAEFKRVTFKTYDGVELAGTFYPSLGGKKEATVLFLHHFDHKEGGNSHKDGWDKLAEALQQQGYSVLSFDFRGFGESTTVDPAVFRSRYAHNRDMVRLTKGDTKGETIDQKNFLPAYYKYLVNDVAAAKAFLERKNDGRELNASNIIVIGAGHGATVGAMWLAAECRRRKDSTPMVNLPLPVGMLGDPESRDIAACIWLGISPQVGNNNVGQLVKNWTRMAAKEMKIPTAFVYGKNDAKGDTFAKECIKNIQGTAKTKLDNVAEKAIEDTNLTDSKLLARTLGTEKWILGALDGVMEKRSTREWQERKPRDYSYYYVPVVPNTNTPIPTKSIKVKAALSEDSPSVPVQIFMPGS